MADRTQGTALVLGGGGVLAVAWEVGVLAGIEERWGEGAVFSSFDTFLGTSGGSFVAALVSQGIAPGLLREGFLREDPELMPRPADVARISWAALARGAWRLAAGVAGAMVSCVASRPRGSLFDVFARGLERLPAGFLTVDQLEDWLERLFARHGLASLFADAPRRLLIPAVDLDAGTVRVFGDAPESDPPIGRAVAASSAIPSVFAPVRVGKRWFVDGAVGGATHLRRAIERGARRVLFVNPVVASCWSAPGEESCECRLVSRGGLGQIVDQCNKLAHEAAVGASVEAARLRHPDRTILLLQPDRDRMSSSGLMSWRAHRETLEMGRQAVLEAEAPLVARLDELLGAQRPDAASPRPGPGPA